MKATVQQLTSQIESECEGMLISMDACNGHRDIRDAVKLLARMLQALAVAVSDHAREPKEDQP